MSCLCGCMQACRAKHGSKVCLRDSELPSPALCVYVIAAVHLLGSISARLLHNPQDGYTAQRHAADRTGHPPRHRNKHLSRLRALLTPARAEAAPISWPRLRHLSCTHNSFRDMDASLAAVPQLQQLELAYNNLGSVRHLEACSQLTRLVLACNRFASLQPLSGQVSQLQSLNLQVGLPVWASSLGFAQQGA